MKKDAIWIKIRVSDHGPGFKNIEKAGRMFEELIINHNVNQNGLGFGIKISRDIMEKLGGFLQIKNKITKN